MPAPERIVLDGFSYLIFKRTDGIVAVEFTDEARGLIIEAHFPAEGWQAFLEHATTGEEGVIIASPDQLRRLGV